MDIIKFSTDNNIGIEIKPMDGSFRPLVGKVRCVVIFKKNNMTTSITVTETDTEETIELALQDMLRKLTYKED